MSRPKCPNHLVEMIKTDEPRIFICPVSSARFECDVDEASKEVKYDIHGNAIHEWKVISLGEEK